jgi:SAM-dependent methyltransferase
MLQPTRALVLTTAILLSPALAADGQPLPQAQKRTPDVVYVGTPYDVVSKMIKLAGVRKQDVVFDLGCGDGRMIVLAAQKYGCRGTGYDIDPEQIAAALANVKRSGVAHLVTIGRRDIFGVDFRNADVLLLYLHSELYQKLLPKFEKLKPGSRLVSHDFAIPGIEADAVIRVVSNEDNVRHSMFMYTTPFRPASNKGPTR